MSGFFGSSGGGVGGGAVVSDWAALQALSPSPGDAVYLREAEQQVAFPSAGFDWICQALANDDRTALSSEVAFWADAYDIGPTDHTAGALSSWPVKTGDTAATAIALPAYSATGGPGGTRPAVALNGSTQSIAWPSDHLAALNDADGFLMLMVVRSTGLGGANIGTFFSINNTPGASTFKANYQASDSSIRIGTSVPSFSGQNLGVSISTGSWHVVGFRAMRGDDKCRVYSSDSSTGDGWLSVDTVGALNGSTNNFPAVDAVEAFLGAQNPNTTNDHWAGSIAEAIGLRGSWSRLERRAETIGAYLKSKWGL